jgi:hypothetical protein
MLERTEGGHNGLRKVFSYVDVENVRSWAGPLSESYFKFAKSLEAQDMALDPELEMRRSIRDGNVNKLFAQQNMQAALRPGEACEENLTE